ncbi:MAG: histidine phosphatase family protein [Sedimentisphaerales bacterium]|nr:histidine phosphatase family protein [Sedimentisphaerales bacterium]
MKTLLLMRHAKSSWKDQSLSDHERPLNKRGKRDAPRMGELIKQKHLVPDMIISSTAVRARKTAEKVAQACGYTGEVVLRQELYHASPGTCLAVLARLGADNETVLLIAHNPGMVELLDMLSDNPLDFPTAALAQITFEVDEWSDISLGHPGCLMNFWRPRELE